MIEKSLVLQELSPPKSPINRKAKSSAISKFSSPGFGSKKEEDPIPKLKEGEKGFYCKVP